LANLMSTLRADIRLAKEAAGVSNVANLVHGHTGKL